MINPGPADIRRAAMDMLARREHSRHELTRKLTRRFSVQTIASSGNDSDNGPGNDQANGLGKDPGDADGVNSLEDLIEQELRKLRKEGLQSDARLAEAFIRARTGKGQGPVKIRMELKSQGVSEEDMALAFETCSVDWYALAHQVAEKKFGQGFQGQPGGKDQFGSNGSDGSDGRNGRNGRNEKSRLFRFLQQRGFSHDHISSLYRTQVW